VDDRRAALTFAAFTRKALHREMQGFFFRASCVQDLKDFSAEGWTVKPCPDKRAACRFRQEPSCANPRRPRARRSGRM
jgi:hypothetical protein